MSLKQAILSTKTIPVAQNGNDDLAQRIPSFKRKTEVEVHNVAIYDLDGAKMPGNQSAVGVIIDTDTGNLTHLLRTSASAMQLIEKDIQKKPALRKSYRDIEKQRQSQRIKEKLLQRTVPSYEEEDIVVYQEEKKPHLPSLYAQSAEAKKLLPPTVLEALKSMNIPSERRKKLDAIEIGALAPVTHRNKYLSSLPISADTQHSHSR